jgi:hypothetical protein
MLIQRFLKTGSSPPLMLFRKVRASNTKPSRMRLLLKWQKNIPRYSSPDPAKSSSIRIAGPERKNAGITTISCIRKIARPRHIPVQPGRSINCRIVRILEAANSPEIYPFSSRLKLLRISETSIKALQEKLQLSVRFQKPGSVCVRPTSLKEMGRSEIRACGIKVTLPIGTGEHVEKP